ncbi:MAG: peptide-methionine (R)-S-oxide reductase MsrB [Proteobacteria bacterium]|nr:peptide-methionine (R)-S-oxide reductase MsrB [Pseudomonadota bacterium]
MTQTPAPDRRLFLAGAGAAAFTLAACGAEAKPNAAELAFAKSPYRKLTEAEWRKRLSPPAFDVLRKEGTERAGSSPLDREKRRGTFVCAGCSLPLFKSEAKFDSGTGWPSFVTSIKGSTGTKRDLVLLIPRTEYHCARCLGHQGHIFDDGPANRGGKRWCNNGVALKFIPA